MFASSASLRFPLQFRKILHLVATTWIGRMSKRLTSVYILVLAFGMSSNVFAASTLKVTCTGNLTNTRADGVTLGNCDLNFVSVKQMDEVESVCGIPGTVDSPTENQCRIKAVVSPDQISTADKRKLYKVIEVWSVDKR
jgi:hypothetical protein